MRYGILIPNWAPFTDVLQVELAVAAERVGFDYAFFTDHLTNPHAELDGYPPHATEAWTLISYVAALTSRIRLGTLVTPVGVRPPGLLAKEVATVDRLSGGRVDLGVGSGSAAGSFEMTGVDYGTRATRFARLREGVELVRRLWTEPVVDFSGTYFTAEAVTLGPKPAQRNGPPIWLGGFGPRMVDLTAEVADGWLPYHRPLDEWSASWARIRQRSDALGRTVTAGTVLMVIRDDLPAGPRLTGQPDEPRVTVDTVTQAARDYEAAGAELFVAFLFPSDRALDTVEELARRLL
jgi:probable F420-dependent oxidoreductase